MENFFAILGDAAAKIGFSICVTVVAMHFENPRLLWWYLMILLIDFSYVYKAEK